MSHQLTFADSEFSGKRRPDQKEIFLSRMEAKDSAMAKHGAKSSSRLPKAGSGRRPYPLETMLRIHCMQHCTT